MVESQQRYEELKDELAELQAAYDRQSAFVQDSITKKNHLSNELHSANSLNEQLSTQLNEMQQSANTQPDRYNDDIILSEQLLELKVELESVRHALKKAEDKNQDLLQQQSSISDQPIEEADVDHTRELTVLRSNMADTLEELAELQEAYDKQSVFVKNTFAKQKDLMSALASSQSQLDMLKQGVSPDTAVNELAENFGKSKPEAEPPNTGLAQELDDLKKNHDSLLQEIDTLNTRIQTAEGTNQQKEEEINNLTQRVRELSSELEKFPELQSELERLQHAVQEGQNLLSEQEAKLSARAEQVQQLEQALSDASELRQRTNEISGPIEAQLLEERTRSSELSHQLNEIAQIKDAADAECVRLKEELSAEQADKQKIQDEVKRLTEEAAAAEAKYQTNHNSLEEANAEYATLLSQVNEQQQLIDTKDQTIADLGDRLREAQDLGSIAAESIEEYRSKCEDLEKRIKELRSGESQIAQVQDQLYTLKVDYDSSVAQLERAMEEKNEIQKEILDARDLIAILQKQSESHSDAMIASEGIRAELQAAQNMITELQGQIADREALLLDSNTQKSHLEQMCNENAKSIEGLQQTVEMSEINLKEREALLIEQARRLEDLNNENGLMKTELSSLRQEVATISEKWSNAEASGVTSTEQIQWFQDRVRSLEQEVKQLAKDNERFRSEYEGAQQDLKNLVQQKVSIEEQYRESISSLTQAKAELADVTTLLTEMREVSSTHEQTVLSLRQASQDLEARTSQEIEELRAKLELAEQQVQQLQTNVPRMDELQQQIEASMASNQELSQTIQRLELEKGQLEAHCGDAGNQITQLHEHMQAMDEELHQLKLVKQELDEVRALSEQQQLARDSLESTLNGKEIELNQTSTSLHKATRRIDELTELTRSAEARLATEESTILQLKAQLDKSATDNEGDAAAIRDLKAELISTQTLHTTVTESLGLMTAEKDALEVKYTEKLQSIEFYEARLSSYETELLELKQNHEAKEKRMLELSDRLREAQDLGSVAAESIEEYKSKCEDLEKQIHELRLGESQVSQLQDQLQQMKEECDRMKHELDNVVKDNGQLQQLSVETQEQLSAQARELHATSELQQHLQDDVISKDIQISELDDSIATQQARFALVEAKLSETNESLAETVNSYNILHEKYTQAEYKIEEYNRSMESSAGVRERLEAEINSLQQNAATLTAKLQDVQLSGTHSTQQLESYQHKIDALTRDIATAQEQLDTKDREREVVLQEANKKEANLLEELAILKKQTSDARQRLSELQAENNRLQTAQSESSASLAKLREQLTDQEKLNEHSEVMISLGCIYHTHMRLRPLFVKRKNKLPPKSKSYKQRMIVNQRLFRTLSQNTRPVSWSLRKRTLRERHEVRSTCLI